MIDFSDKTYNNLIAEQLEKIPDTYDKREGSFFYTSIAPCAYALEDVYLTLNRLQRSAFVQTAGGDSLDLLAVIGGVSRGVASPAVRLGVFDVSVPIGARFSTVNGSNSINFIVTETTSNPLEYKLTAETSGTIGNNYTGLLLPITVIEGLNSAKITDIIKPGEDTEDDEALRARLIDALKEKPFSGNVADYKSKILNIDGVGAVQIFPTWAGGGSVKCSILGADFRKASAELVDTVQETIDPVKSSGNGYGLAPIGAKVTITTTEETKINVSAKLVLQVGTTLEQVRPIVSAEIEKYLLKLRKDWGNIIQQGENMYSTVIYISRVTATILFSAGVVNVSDVTLNGDTKDIILEENATTQQIPILGQVVLNV